MPLFRIPKGIADLELPIQKFKLNISCLDDIISLKWQYRFVIIPRDL